MVHASESFSHKVASCKEEQHKLITTGVYGYVHYLRLVYNSLLSNVSLVRHPSYLGFYVWALGAQVILLNPISFVVFAAVLRDFFKDRIKSKSILTLT